MQAALPALPFAWFAGVILARLIAGPAFGVLPAMIIPMVLIGALVFSLFPFTDAKRRREIMVGGAVASFAMTWLLV